jgi:hypothetical protein
MDTQVSKLNAVLKKGAFNSKVSDIAKEALIDSISLHKKQKYKSKKSLSLDFSQINKISIEKRDNLKVYQNLPKGIRVVA